MTVHHLKVTLKKLRGRILDIGDKVSDEMLKVRRGNEEEYSQINGKEKKKKKKKEKV
jgi:hypothetical protein